MDDKIVVKRSRHVNSRTPDENLTKEELYTATVNHINDVKKGMDYFSELIHERGLKHDHTKIDNFDDEYAPLVLSRLSNEEFENHPWNQKHFSEERHHINNNAHSDIDLVDIIEHLVDVTLSGLSRAGYVNSKYAEVSPLLLYRAYWNSIHKLEQNVEVFDDKAEKET